MFSSVRASSDMRLGSHGGSHTILTLASRTPGTPATAFLICCGNSAAEGQFGLVSVISMLTVRSSSMLTLLNQTKLVDVGRDFRIVDSLERPHDLVGQACHFLRRDCRPPLHGERRRGFCLVLASSVMAAN